MSFLIDTSALVHLLRDRSGEVAVRYDELIGGQDAALSRITVFELLKGAKSKKEWAGLLKLFGEETIISPTDAHWVVAAQIVFDLRRRGVTLGNSIDCVIAQAALDGDLALVHDDDDFERIATLRPLKLERLRESPSGVAG